MSDVIFSHQVSLPSMIYEHDCDTQLPNNIFDDEFFPDMKELPPSRPITEPTPIAYMISKAKLCNELGNILQVTSRVGKHVPYDEIIRFDAKLRQIIQELPPHLKLTNLEGSHDPVTLIIARFNIDILYQKILCLLHRKYLPRARQNPRYAHSRRSAVEASLEALNHLSVLSQEASSNGRLRSVAWYIKSIATNDFILPAMLIILDLHFDNIARQSSASTDAEGGFLWNDKERDKMIASLREAQSIWKRIADTSMEAFKANKIVDIMLNKINNPQPETVSSMEESGQESVTTATNNTGYDPSVATSQGFALPTSLGGFNLNAFSPFPNPNSNNTFITMDFGMTLGSEAELNTDSFGNNIGSSPGAMPMFSNMQGGSNLPDVSGNFDWVSRNRAASRLAFCKSANTQLLGRF